MRISAVVLALCLSLLSLTPVSASVGDIDQAIAKNDFHGAVGHAVRMRDEGAAGAWIVDYAGAYVLLKEGRTAEALEIARTLTARRPDDFRVRHLLIIALVADRDYKSAVYHIRHNMAESTDERVRSEYADMLSEYEKANPSTGMSVSVGANPSTNVTRGSGQETIIIRGLPFVVDEASRERAGGTVTLGLSGFRKKAIGENTDLVMSGGVSLEKGVSGTETDVVSLRPSLQVVHHFEDTVVSAGPMAELQFLEYEAFARRAGFSGRIWRALGDKTSVSLAGTAELQDYIEADFLDGYKLSETVSLRRSLGKGAAATLTARHEYENTEAAHLTYHKGEARIGLEKQWKNGVFADLSGSYARKQYQADFPIANEPRRDDRYEVQAGIAHDKIALYGIMPYVGVRYTRNVSNISLYDYDSTDVILSGRKKF